MDYKRAAIQLKLKKKRQTQVQGIRKARLSAAVREGKTEHERTAEIEPRDMCPLREKQT